MANTRYLNLANILQFLTSTDIHVYFYFRVPKPTVAESVTRLVIKTAVYGGLAYGTFRVGRTALRKVNRFIR